MTTEKNSPTDTSDREMVITRVFDAPRELVFEAWTDTKHLARWWGPNGFTITTEHMEFKPGGSWKFTMHGPDGRDYPNHVVYSAIVRPERIDYAHVGEGPDHVGFESIITFETQGKQTKVTLRAIFPTAGDRDRVVKEYGAIEGGKQTLARLGELMEAWSCSNPVVLKRTFNAPRDLVWKAWTERDRLAQWFGPKGFAIAESTLDLRPGGKYVYCMRSSGNEMWGRWVFREIVPPERLVYINSFSDKEGGLTRAPFAGTWPLEMLSIVSFTEEAGKTTITLLWFPINTSDEERKTFDDGRPGMNAGWTGTFNQLDEYLATA